MTTTLDVARTTAFVQKTWEGEILPTLTEYVRIPAKSPMFDPDWKAHGHLDRAVSTIEQWSRARAIEGLRVEVVRLEGRTPVIVMEVPGRGADTVLLYGHCDKQPEMVGWSEGLGPWTPVRRGDKLYGRGAADDGYAAFAALTSIQALQAQGVPHARCVVLIEACEESGSYDLPHYVDALAARIGTPSLVVCLDSGCSDYEHLWTTTSLRGVVNGLLTVEVLTEGVHSGAASGIVPSSFRILRSLLSRVEDERTGEILLRDLHADIPRERVEQARAVSGMLAKRLAEFPFVPGMRPMHDDPLAALLAGTWRPALSITGAAGLPSPTDGGNVLRPQTAAKLSLRLPPTVSAAHAAKRLKETLEAEPPYGARVTFEAESPGDGWDAPATVGRLFRTARDVAGHGRLDSVHGDAGRPLPAGAVHDHGRARSRQQRARAERVPARADGRARDRVRGVRARRPRRAAIRAHLLRSRGAAAARLFQPLRAGASGGAAVAGLQAVEDVADAGHGGSDVLGQASHGALLHPALERDVAVLHAYVDLARIQARVVRHPLANVLADALVCALAVVRPALRLRPRRQRRVAGAADAGADLPADAGFAAPALAPLGRAIVTPEVAPLERLHGQARPSIRAEVSCAVRRPRAKRPRASAM